MKTLQNKRIRTYKKSADKIPKNRLFFEPLEERLPVSASILGLLGGVAALSETLNDVEAVSIDNSSFVAERNDASLLNAALTSETTSSFTSLEQETTLSGIDSINR
ncbi:MAG: hypothetical protein LBT05_05590, partial [Planctomycetaceae bacterium]|nr:hypothetical protein [Planctomycetaceae bacterium]